MYAHRGILKFVRVETDRSHLDRICGFLNRLAEKLVGPGDPIKKFEDEQANRQADLDRANRDYENRVNF